MYRPRDAGQSWERCATGLPTRHAWLTVLRQGLAVDAHDPVGLYFGTTSGEVWASSDEGATWRCIARHLPHVRIFVKRERVVALALPLRAGDDAQILQALPGG